MVPAFVPAYISWIVSASSVATVALPEFPAVIPACDTIQSRRIRQLCAVETDTAAERGFWAEIDGHAPLHELIPPRNDGDELTTFLWHGDPSTIAVDLDAPLPPPRNARWSEGPRPLTHLAGTELWYRTERLPLDFRMSYTFRVTRRSGTAPVTESHSDPLNHADSL